MEDRLKPCPFCGGEAELLNNGHDYFWVICMNRECGCEMSGMDSLKAAYEQWNTRKPMDRIVEQLEKVMDYNEKSYKEWEKTSHAQIYKIQANTYKKAIEIVKAGGVND